MDLTWNGSLSQNWGFEASVYYNRISDAILSHNIDTDTIQNREQWSQCVYTGPDAGVKGKVFSMLDVGCRYGLIHADAKRSDIGKITDLPTRNPDRLDDAETVGATQHYAVRRGPFVKL